MSKSVVLNLCAAIFFKNLSPLLRNRLVLVFRHYFLGAKIKKSETDSKCAANFEKIPNCAAGAKRLRSTGLN